MGKNGLQTLEEKGRIT